MKRSRQRTVHRSVWKSIHNFRTTRRRVGPVASLKLNDEWRNQKMWPGMVDIVENAIDGSKAERVWTCITHVKNAQVVIQQTRSNAVPTTHCLVPACWQVVNGLLTTCYKVVELNRLVASCSNNLLSSCNSTICQPVVSDNLVTTW
jgi:hypothetical protein